MLFTLNIFSANYSYKANQSMPVINFMGTKLYLRMKPTFEGAKAPVLCRVPYTADNPTLPQRKARYWLASAAHGLQGTYGRDPKMTKLATAIKDKAPGKGTHGGLKTLREYAVKRRVSDARIEALRAAAA